MDVGIRPGDAGDATDLFSRISEIEARLSEVFETEEDAEIIATITADKGYHSTEEFTRLDHAAIPVVIPSPGRHRNRDKLAFESRRYWRPTM